MNTSTPAVRSDWNVPDLRRALWVSIFIFLGVSVASAGEPRGPNDDPAASDPAASGSAASDPAASGSAASGAAASQSSLQLGTEVEATTRRLRPLLLAAESAAKRFDSQIKGYTCLLIKRERTEGKLSGHQYMWIKVREPRRKGDELETPHSIYIRYLKPADVAGREILYVENERGGDVLARKGGRRLPNLTLQVAPNSRLAMSASRHPITKAGIRPLLKDLIENMHEESDNPDCVLSEYKSAQLDGRPCRHFELRQKTRRPDLDYQIARVLLDEETRLPLYFASYDWADEPGGEPQLQEEYIYLRLHLNPGLTDQDFQRDHPDYEFPPEDDEPDEELKLRAAAPQAE